MAFPYTTYSSPMDQPEELELKVSPNISSVSTESFYSTDSSNNLPGSRNTLTEDDIYIFQTDEVKIRHEFGSKNRTRFGRKMKSQSLPPGISLRNITLEEKSTLEAMNEHELRENIENSFLENSQLKIELAKKDKALFSLTEYLGEFYSKTKKYRDLLSNNGRRSQEEVNVDIFELDTSNTDLCAQESSNELELFRPRPQHSTTSILEEIREAIRESRPVIEEKIIFGSHFVAGGFLGSLTSYLLRKYGMTALTAIAGGVLVIHVASKKGYIAVNWGEIYKKIEKKSEENAQIKSEGEWAVEQLENIKLWIVENKYFAVGFVAPFFFKMFK